MECNWIIESWIFKLLTIWHISDYKAQFKPKYMYTLEKLCTRTAQSLRGGCSRRVHITYSTESSIIQVRCNRDQGHCDVAHVAISIARFVRGRSLFKCQGGG